ncbi:MAG: amidohydrolase family protein [Candidatus Hydrogenedentes bacterium]|nr:amidohydrolase family protein [Candidatus Hydrogenedentota bacterium]
MNAAFDDVLDYVNGLEIVDTHEHLPASESKRPQDTDVLREYLTHYFNRDLISAGLSKKEFAQATDAALPIADRWRIVEPYWEAARATGYGQCLDLAAQGLYGIPKICAESIEELDDAFQKSLAPGHYRYVLKEKSRIHVSLVDSDLDCDREFFRSVYRLDSFVYPSCHNDLAGIERRTGLRIRRFDDWLEACETDLAAALDKGAVALKSGLAYVRSLQYARATRHEAEEEFNRFIATVHREAWLSLPIEASRKFQDYMMHFVLHLADRHGLTFQFHTGLQEGNGNVIANSDPTLLSNLFIEYPGVKFDIFHIGYPYQQAVSVLAKTFPNVFIDMCWAHIISPPACVDALAEWLEVVPVNKISAFGGDFCFVDGVYGHQVLARRDVSKALARKVEEGLFDAARAKEIAEMVFVTNPRRLFGLGRKR